MLFGISNLFFYIDYTHSTTMPSLCSGPACACKKRSARGDAFCYTSYAEAPFSLSNIRGAIFHACQRERCPSTGRDHWQGFVAYKSNTNKVLGTLIDEMSQSGVSITWSKAHNRAAASNYCIKSSSAISDPIVEGFMPNLKIDYKPKSVNYDWKFVSTFAGVSTWVRRVDGRREETHNNPYVVHEIIRCPDCDFPIDACQCVCPKCSLGIGLCCCYDCDHPFNGTRYDSCFVLTK